MRVFGLLMSGALIGLAACSQTDKGDGDESVIGADNVAQTLPVIATHAFDTPLKSVQTIAFSPNDVASWLGAVALLDRDGKLYTTNIEGSSQTALAAGQFVDVIGLSRAKEPALFMALTEDGAIKAFVESDDQGGFSPLAVISAAPKIARFCRGPQAETDSITVITKAGNLAKIDLSIQNNSALSLGGEQSALVDNIGPVASCAHMGSNAIYIAQQRRAGLTLAKVSGDTLTDGAVISDVTANNADNAPLDYVKATLAYIAPNDNEGFGYIAAQLDGVGAPQIYDAQTLTLKSALKIDNGLSIIGLKSGRSVYATQSSFGGSAFDSGIIAIPDTDSDRVVILSRSYLLDQIESPSP